jgi:prepilin-type N-terminal cleavage/methylation domain-containing protein
MILSTLTKRRRGFTLIEVLVVIGIIGILVAITLTGAFKARGSAEKSLTVNNMQKIASALDQQLKTVADQAADIARSRPQWFSDQMIPLALGDDRRAKALLLKLTLRRELPVTMAEVNGTYTLPTPVRLPTAGVNRPVPPYPLTSPTTFRSVAGQSFASTDVESAVLLYISVTAGRRGLMFDPDQAVGSSGVGTVTSANNTPFKVFVDAWGTPIKLVRAIRNNDSIFSSIQVDELDKSKYAGNAASKDPQDREGMLQKPWTPVAFGLTVAENENVKTQFLNYIGYDAGNHNRQPFIVSAGEDKQFGTDDDIYSFRFREVGQRGD